MHRLTAALSAAVLGSLALVLVAAPSASATCAGDAKAGFARVQLWKDPGCGGGSTIVPQEGDDDRPDFAKFRNYDGKVFDVDNSRSSIGVAAGYCVRLFDGRNYAGEDSSLVCGEGATGYRELGALDNRASSMRTCPRADTAQCSRPQPPPTPDPTPTPTPTPTPVAPPPPPPPPVPNGAPASRTARLAVAFKSSGRTRGTVDYRRRTSATAALTTETGMPIAGAVLQVFQRELRVGTRPEYRDEVTTGPDGRARVEVPAGSSRTLQVQYRATSTEPQPVVATTLRLGVRAGVTIRLTPGRVRPGRRLRVSGTLLGTPRPPRGKLVSLQAFDRGRWRTFGTARASRRTGRYALNYRFGTRARGSFRMRVQVRVDAAYPYALGYSTVRRVRVGR